MVSSEPFKRGCRRLFLVIHIICDLFALCTGMVEIKSASPTVIIIVVLSIGSFPILIIISWEILPSVTFLLLFTSSTCITCTANSFHLVHPCHHCFHHLSISIGCCICLCCCCWWWWCGGCHGCCQSCNLCLK
jgi:hypothetical protein